MSYNQLMVNELYMVEKRMYKGLRGKGIKW